MGEHNNILEDAREIRERLFHRGHDFDEGVIRELLESYNSDHSMNKTEYIINMITDNLDKSQDIIDISDLGVTQDITDNSDLGVTQDITDNSNFNITSNNLDSNLEKSSNFKESPERSDEAGSTAMQIETLPQSDAQNSMKCEFVLPKETIDVFSDSDDDRDFYYQSENNDDIMLIDTVTGLLPSRSSLEPYVNISPNRAIATSNTSQRAMEENNNDICMKKTVDEKTRLSESPQPGCSKDFDKTKTFLRSEKSLQNYNIWNIRELQKETQQIYALLAKSKSYSYISILKQLLKYHYAENRIELALWNLLPVSMPVVKYKQRNLHQEAHGTPKNNCHCIFFKENSIGTETILEKEVQAEHQIKAANMESKAAESALIKIPIVKRKKTSINEEIMVMNDSNNVANKQTVAPVGEANAENQIKAADIELREDLDSALSMKRTNGTKRSITEETIVVNDTNNVAIKQSVIPIREAKLNNLNVSEKDIKPHNDDIPQKKSPLIRKSKLDMFDAPDKVINPFNNDTDQGIPELKKKKLSKLDPSNKGINLFNMHDSEKLQLLQAPVKNMNQLQPTKDFMLETKADSTCKYTTSPPVLTTPTGNTLLRPGKLTLVAGPSTSSSLPTSILSQPKFNYMPGNSTQVLPSTSNQDTQKPSTSQACQYKSSDTSAKDKKTSNMDTAQIHSSVNLVKDKVKNCQPELQHQQSMQTDKESFLIRHVDAREKLLDFEYNRILSRIMPHLFSTPVNLKNNNTLQSKKVGEERTVLNLSVKKEANNGQASGSSKQGGDGNGTLQVCDKGNEKQRQMPLANAETSANKEETGGPSNANHTKAQQICSKIILNEKALKLYYKVIPMFPNVHTDFIKQLCQNCVDEHAAMDEATLLQNIVEHLLIRGVEHPCVKIGPAPTVVQNNYDLNEQYADLLVIFPNADPVYLRETAEKIYDDPEKMKQFVQSKLEKPDYPTRDQYLAKKKITDQQKQYTSDFQVQQFLEIFPDPFTHFEDPKKQYRFNAYIVDFLKQYFNKIRVNTMLGLYGKNGYNLSLTVKALEALSPDMKTKRCCGKIMLTEDIPVLQEIAFIQHKAEIKRHLDQLKAEEEKEFNNLKARNELLECQCCYDNECMPSKCSTCEDGHVFCNLCIARSTDVILAEGKTHVNCLLNCGSEFPLSILQQVLKPTKFSILLCKRQEAEVMAAGVEGLVSCPFCHFASIPPPEDKIFKCLNPDCMKESCRLCKEVSHVPFKCNEVKEVDAARLLLEEKMTQALVRKCYQCGRTFFKEDGCNKMTCVCGALMCYICDKPVKGYDHFQGQGVVGSNLCPLWSDDRRMNAEAVIKVCHETMKHIKEKNPNVNINVESLLPKLPPKTRGPHEDVANANALPAHINRVARQIQ